MQEHFIVYEYLINTVSTVKHNFVISMRCPGGRISVRSQNPLDILEMKHLKTLFTLCSSFCFGNLFLSLSDVITFPMIYYQFISSSLIVQ